MHCVQCSKIKHIYINVCVFVCVRYNDVLQRCKELDSWTQDLSLPSVVWLSGLFNPQSFLTGKHTVVHKEELKNFVGICVHVSHHLSRLLRLLLFLAVMQTLARKNEWPLDKVNLTVDVTKKFKEEFNQPAREGAYVYGLYMEGTVVRLVMVPFCLGP